MSRLHLLLAAALAIAACGGLKVLPPAQPSLPAKRPTGPPLPPAPGVTVLAHEPVPLDETLVRPPKSEPLPRDGGVRELGSNDAAVARPDAPAVPSAGDLVSVEPPEPPAPDAGPLERGAYLYALHCATCHGVGGDGDGPSGAALLYPPSDLTRIAERRGGLFIASDIAAHLDGQVEHPSHGTAEAPVWGTTLATADPGSADLAALLAFLETLQRPVAEPVDES